MNRIAPSYSECVKEIWPIIKFCLDNKIRLKLPDFPFCVFGKDKLENYIKMTDDYDYGTRVNVFRNKKEIDRWDLKEQKTLPRERQHFDKCNNCKYIDMCWGPSKHYDILYTLDEINPII
jgi:radical SAM protein with 4Fe4S-binding SPASM domain